MLTAFLRRDIILLTVDGHHRSHISRHHPVLQFTRGLVWVSTGAVGARLFTLVGSVLLARLLAPQDFGLLNMALIAINALQIVLDLGLGQALIAQREEVEQAASTIFYTICAFSLSLALVLVLAAPSIAGILHQPAVAPILQVLALNIVIGALATVPVALLQKAQRWRAQALVESLPSLVSTGVMVALALARFGVWSIVYGHIARALTQAVVVWWLMPWRPSGGIRRRFVRQLFRFGKWIVLDRVSSFIFLNADNAYLARWQGAQVLGYYALPYNWVTLPVQYIVFQSNRVMFPLLTSLQQVEEQRTVFLRVSRLLSFLLLPVYLFWVFHAEVFVVGLFGSKWLPSVPVLRWLAIYAIGRALVSGPVGSFYWATRRPELAVYPIWAGLALIFAGLVMSGGNLDAVGIAQLFTAGMLIRVLLTVWELWRYYSFPLTEMFRALLHGALPALSASGLVYLLALPLILPEWQKLIMAVFLYGIIYLLLYGTLTQRKPFLLFRVSTWKNLLTFGAEQVGTPR